MGRAPYPLQWPDGWPRTPNDRREYSRFYSQRVGPDGRAQKGILGKIAVSLVDACQEVVHQLDQLGAANGTITSNLPTKNNGMPYATGPRISDPGIAVWWIQDGDKEMVLACDRWIAPADNVRAIAKTIDAIRGMARWGSSAIVEKAFGGFAALPPAGATSGERTSAPPPPEPSRDWMDYFHVSEAASRSGIKAMYRAFAKELHPDRNKGDSARMAELNIAWKGAETWFDWRDAMMGIDKTVEG